MDGVVLLVVACPNDNCPKADCPNADGVVLILLNAGAISCPGVGVQEVKAPNPLLIALVLLPEAVDGSPTTVAIGVLKETERF